MGLRSFAVSIELCETKYSISNSSKIYSHVFFRQISNVRSGILAKLGKIFVATHTPTLTRPSKTTDIGRVPSIYFSNTVTSTQNEKSSLIYTITFTVTVIENIPISVVFLVICVYIVCEN